MKKRLFSAVAALLLLAGCGKGDVTPGPTPTLLPEPTPTVTIPPADKTEVNFAVLSGGPSGIGAVKLMTDSEAGTTVNRYNVTIAGANDEVMAGLINDSIDIALVASNVAANLYNKTEGDVQIAAISGLGVLYLLENGDEIGSFSDLKGRQLYATGQGANPEYVLNYLLTENGVDPADVDVQWRTAEEVSQAMASGEAKICMLPVPAATGVLQKNPDVREALDFSQAWDDLQNGSRLTMTAIVVRRAFAEENSAAVDAFLEEYAASVAFVTNPGNMAISSNINPAQLVAHYGLTPNAEVAQAAIPKSNLVCVTGVSEVRDAIQGYYEVLWAADPKSIGGSIPDDGFFYGG